MRTGSIALKSRTTSNRYFECIHSTHVPAMLLTYTSLVDHVMAWDGDKSHNCKETVEGLNAAKKKLTEYYFKTTQMQVATEDGLLYRPRVELNLD